MTTGRGFRCGVGEIGHNSSVILPAEHVRRYEPCCDKASQRRPTTKRRRNGPLTLSSPTALLSSAPEWQAQFYKTKLCPFYVRDIPDALAAQETAAQVGHNVGSAIGICMNRDACRFAHSYAELRPLPDLRKTKLCSSYTKKTPCKNAKCPFAHSPAELRTSSSVFYKVTLCNFYKNGRCWNGANCRFAHGNDELRSGAGLGEVEEEDCISTTTTSSRTKKVKRREKTADGLLPTPLDTQRIYEKHLALPKSHTTVSTTSNSVTTTPPGTIPADIPDTETLINLVTQRLLDDAAPPGFPELPPTPPPPLPLDAETLVSLLLGTDGIDLSQVEPSIQPEIPVQPFHEQLEEDDDTVSLLLRLIQGYNFEESQSFAFNDLAQ